jgi:transcriptional regulator with XRE-family HTH domain
VFEIGSSLRDARIRQGLQLADVERATKIRARYLAALENDDFEALPGPAYARGFLRSYADYLGLEAQRFVDEYHSRFAPPDEAPTVAPARVERPRFAAGRWLAAAGIVAAALVALIAWQLTSGGSNERASRQPFAPVTTTAPRQRTTTRTAPAVPTVARLTLAATRGPCWVSVHIGSANGKFVWEGTLEPGRTVHFVSRRLWLRFGAPWNVDARLNGKSTTLPTQTGDVVVTPRAISSPTQG